MASSFLNALGGSRFYPITDRAISGLSHAEQVSRLSLAGATIVQIRDKVLSPLEFYREAEAAMRVARESGIKIIINDRVDIALALEADGVHLGQDDLLPEMARKILGPNIWIGFSTHNADQARSAVSMPIDYLAIGPIFATSTKESPNQPVGLNGLRLAREIVGSTPLVAIGGLTSANSQGVFSEGADAIALISDLWRPSGLTTFREPRLA